jgi:hypothetical protein
MTFDYRARPGPATTSNARRIWAALMEHADAPPASRSADADGHGPESEQGRSDAD